MVEQYCFGEKFKIQKWFEALKKLQPQKTAFFCGDEIAKSFPFFIASKMSNDKQQKTDFFYCVAL